MRDIHGSTQFQLDNLDSHEIANLVHIELGDDLGGVVQIFLTDFATDLYNQVDGNTYVGLGQLLSISPADSSATLDIKEMRLGLTGVDGIFTSLLLNYRYMDQKVSVWKCLLYQGMVLNDPFKIFEGRLNSPTISDDPENGTATIEVQASNYLSDFDRKIGRYTNSSQQQSLNPNDEFFSVWGKIDKEIIWGKLD